MAPALFVVAGGFITEDTVKSLEDIPDAAPAARTSELRSPATANSWIDAFFDDSDDRKSTFHLPPNPPKSASRRSGATRDAMPFPPTMQITARPVCDSRFAASARLKRLGSVVWALAIGWWARSATQKSRF